MAKTDPKGVVTNEYLDGAVDKIIKGVDRMFKGERKYNTETFATKEDLKREASWLKDDIKGLKADLSIVPGRGEFNNLKTKVDRFITP